MKTKLFFAFGAVLLAIVSALVPVRGEIPRISLTPAQEIAISKPGEEITSLRRKNREVFKAAEGRVLARVYAKQKYYVKDDGTFAAPDLSVHDITFIEKLNPFRTYDAYVEAGPYRATWKNDRPHDYTFFADGKHVRFTALFDTTGTVIRTSCTNTGVKQTISLRSERAAHRLMWLIESDAKYEIVKGWLDFTDGAATVFRVSVPEAWDNRGVPVPVTVSVRGDTLVYDVQSPEEAEYPVTVDPTTTVGENDNLTGYLRASSNSFSGARDSTAASNVISYQFDMWCYALTSVSRELMRFDTSGLPNGCLITLVKLKIVVSNTTYPGNGTYLKCIEAQDTLSTAHFNGSMYKKFKGWASSGVYSPIILTDSLLVNSGTSVGDTLTFTFNAVGRGEISKTGTTQFYILSGEDIANTAPAASEWFAYEDDSPYLEIEYTYPYPPANFTMTPLDVSSIACSWEDMSDNEERFYIINQADMSIVDSTAANAEADTVRELSPNMKYVWAAAADSGGMRSYSAPDSIWTLIAAPELFEITVMPVSSDTLAITAKELPNGTSGLTGMEVDALSGSGATDSGWLTGVYTYLDGGLDPDSTYVYRLRYRNGLGTVTDWSLSITYRMGGLDTLVVYLTGDGYDDYSVNSGAGSRDSTVVRAGASDTGERLDGFVSFRLPWQVVNGGIDSLFLTMTRTGEESTDTPALKIYGLPCRDCGPVETRNLGSQDSTASVVSWTVSGGTGYRRSPDLRAIFREWRDLSALRYPMYDFGFRLDDGGQTAGTRAVFLDSSHPSYEGGTYLTIHYTPGYPDSIDYAPGGFMLTVIGPDSIHTSWTDRSAGEYGFVLLNSADSTEVAETDTLARNATSADVGGLVPDSLYQWTVKAFSMFADSCSGEGQGRTYARTPGKTEAEPLSPTSLRFFIVPLDNPAWTKFAVEDSLTGRYVDATAEPDTLRAGPPGDWGWRTYGGWRGASGDTLAGLAPDSLYIIRAKARTSDE